MPLFTLSPKKLRLLSLFPLAVTIASAQPSGPGTLGSNTPGSSPANGGAGGHRTVNNLPPSAMERPIPVRGRVVLDNGTVPPEPVRIEMICGSTTWPGGFTDTKGRFGVQSNPTPEAGQDASIGDPGNLGTTPDSGTYSFPGFNTSNASGRTCDLRATMPGFSSGVVSLAGRGLTPGADIGPVILHRLSNLEGNTVSATTLAAPKEAQKALEKGLDLTRRSKWDDAVKQFDKAIAIYPKYASAWYELGRVRQRQENVQAARAAYLKAVEADPSYVQPYLPLAHLYLAEQKWQEAVKMADTAIRLDPIDFPESFYFSSVGHLYLRHFPEAEKNARAGIKLDDAHRLPKLYQVLGTALIQRRDYPAALETMTRYLELDPTAPDIELVRKQVAELTRVTAARNAQSAKP